MSLDSFHVVPPASHNRANKIALLGFGTVGSAVARRLTGPDAVCSLELTHISDFTLQTSEFELQTSNFKLQTSLAEAV